MRLGAAAFAASSILASIQWVRRPESTPAMRGARVAREAGCFSCHGPDGTRGVANPGAAAGLVPGWDARAFDIHVQRPEELREWVLYGAPRRLAARGPDPRPLLPMPAYEGRLSDRQLDELTAYLLAASGWDPRMPEAVYEGRVAAERLGCFGCHGPSGMGGLENPGSLTGRIPSWTGREFGRLVRDEAELRAWILDGKIQRLWDNPLARFFLKRQIVAMPAYRAHASDDDVAKLVAYIAWLRRQ